MNEHPRNDKRPAFGKYVLIALALIAGYFVVTSHRAHAVEALPYLLLLACPLLHLFHGHGGHKGHGGNAENESPRRGRP